MPITYLQIHICTIWKISLSHCHVFIPFTQHRFKSRINNVLITCHSYLTAGTKFGGRRPATV